MNEFLNQVAAVNSSIYNAVVANFGLWLLLIAGLLLTLAAKGFQFAHIGHWFKHTIGSVFKKDSAANKKDDQKSISQFQALCTALAATIGTGNVVGVATAIVTGGPGAVFWMWVAALLGMMTKFSENVLGIYYRRRNQNGEWMGGAMYYLRDGLGGKKHCKGIGKVLAALFAVFCIIASFGIGNMGQVNSIATNVKNTFFAATEGTADTAADPIMAWGAVGGVPVLMIVIGLVITLVAAVIILGGLKRIAAVAERIVPAMAVMYLIGGIAIVLVNADKVGPALGAIFRFAFGVEAVAGGAAGFAVSTIISKGCSRGVFSNEAGLGSSALVHTAANVKEPVRQGMWGIFEVFFDTIIICTMTALVVLTSGTIDLQTGIPNVEADAATTLVSQSFGKVFGMPGEIFMVIAIALFAFTTILGWSQYGTKAAEYLFGSKGAKVYRVIFVLITTFGAIITGTLAFDICDTFNGFMMIPNLIGVLVLLPLVAKITKNYADRHFHKKKVKPMLSNDSAIQAEFEATLDET